MAHWLLNPWADERRDGGRAHGAYITRDFLSEFGKGSVTIAATTFLRYGEKAVSPMPPVSQGTSRLWMENAKLPPHDEETFRKAATAVPLFSAEWQAKQNPVGWKSPLIVMKRKSVGAD